MKDEQTGSYWQQISGRAVAGPLAGRVLKLVPADELTFKLWRSEEPSGTVLRDAPGHARDYAPPDWDIKMARAPVVVSYAQAGLKARDLMLGVEAFGASRAFPYERVVEEKLVQDYVGSEPVMLVVGPDGCSVRAFRRRHEGSSANPQFYRVNDGRHLFIDAETGSKWNFRGCAVEGTAEGVCLKQVNVIKDYWFDWRNYHPKTTVYGVKETIR